MERRGWIETPPDWQSALQRILAGPARRVLVLGACDAGKSSFCGLLFSQAAEATGQVALLDADPGQKQVGPPACVTLGRPNGEGVPTLSALGYLGTIEPLRGWSQLIVGSVFLAAQAHPDFVVVNTCGLLRGPGRRLKGAMISALRPDLLVAIGEDRDLEMVLADHAGLPVLRLVRSEGARRKGEGERRALRQMAFRAYFEPAPVWSLDPGTIRLTPATDEPLPQPGRLVALADEAGHDMAVGLVVPENDPGQLLLRSPRPDRTVASLRWGSLGLDQTWREHRTTLSCRRP